jgi:septal ring factor EnvC (AmiA/AmiB activator)
MTDDLVKRLRDRRYDGQLAIRTSAADRIEELQKKLEESEAKIAASDKQIEYLEAEIGDLEYEMCELENRS